MAPDPVGLHLTRVNNMEGAEGGNQYLINITPHSMPKNLTRKKIPFRVGGRGCVVVAQAVFERPLNLMTVHNKIVFTASFLKNIDTTTTIKNNVFFICQWCFFCDIRLVFSFLSNLLRIARSPLRSTGLIQTSLISA